MSNDHLLIALEQNAQALVSLRQHQPLFAALACLEDVGTDPFEALHAALTAYVRAAAGPVETVHPSSFCTGGGSTYSLTMYADAGVSQAQFGSAHQTFLPIARRMSGLMRELPDRTRERLGFREVFNTPLHDWVWVLFQLAWHFPERFARGVVHRDRLLSTEFGPLLAPEDLVQLGGLRDQPKDQFPGLIFSRFPRELDLVTATGYAIELLLQAVRGGPAFVVTDELRDRLRRIHHEFVSAGQLTAALARPNGTDLETRVLRLDNSFRTPPASDWAGYQGGGAIQEHLYLSRSAEVPGRPVGS